MKPLAAYRTNLFTALILLCAAIGLQARVWTSVSGNTMEAELVSLEEDSVNLATPKGKNIRIALDKLSAEDRTFVQSTRPPSLGKVELMKGARPGEDGSGTEVQDLRIQFTLPGERTVPLMLKVAFVSMSPDIKGRTMFGLRSFDTNGKYGSVIYPIDATAREAGRVDVGITRSGNDRFIGYRVELIEGVQVLDTYHWDNPTAVASLAGRLDVPADWWYNGQAGATGAAESKQTRPQGRKKARKK